MLFPLIRVWMIVAASSLPTPAPAAKPSCNAQTLGRMWPDAANGNPRLMVKLSRGGDLEICTHGDWRYGWKSPTVSLTQLRDAALSKRAAR
jgi:hypothetical protein